MKNKDIDGGCRWHVAFFNFLSIVGLEFQRRKIALSQMGELAILLSISKCSFRIITSERKSLKLHFATSYIDGCQMGNETNAKK